MGGQQCKESNPGCKYQSRCQQLDNSRSDLTTSLEHSSDAIQFRDDLSFESQQSSQQQSSNEENVDPYSELKSLRFTVEKIVQTCNNRGNILGLKHRHDLILTRFLEEIESRQPLVALEIVIALSKLIQIRGLFHTTWEYILEICWFIVNNFNMSIPVCDSDMQIPGNLFPKQFHDLLSEIERICDLNLLTANVKCKLFNVIEKCWLHRPEESVNRLIEYRSESIVPFNETWTRELSELLDKYLNAERRTSIRKKSLFVLSNVLTRNVACNPKIQKEENQNHLQPFEETLVDNVVLQYMKDIDQDYDEDIRVFAVQILIEITLYCSNPRRSSAVLDLVKKVVERPLHKKNSTSSESDEDYGNDEQGLNDIVTAVNGLVKIFYKKLFISPSSSAATSYKLLINHLTAHYERGLNGDITSIIRKKIIELLLSLRANDLQQIGVICNPTDASVKFSTQVKCSQNDCDTSLNESNSGSHQTSGNATPLNTSLTDSASPVTLLSFTRLFNCLTLALKAEKDWTIFKYIMENLPLFLQNKSALYSIETPQIVKSLCETCISLVSKRLLKLLTYINDRSKNYASFYKGIPASLTKSEFHGLVYPSLVSMIAYNDVMDTPLKKKLVMCLEHGFTSQANICIHALMLCASEMQDIMFKHMADVVLSLSKISATVNLAIPILEFLSHLTLRPTLYSNFIQDQFMSIFAIVLPYTNPFKFNDYTVTMAHKVIAMWFLQCRPPLRRHLVEFIIKLNYTELMYVSLQGLQANVMQPLEENAKEDDRKRSSSLNMNDKRSTDTNRLPGTPRIPPMSPLPLSVDLPSSPSASQHSSASVFSFNSVDNQHQHHLTAIANANKQHSRNQINESFHKELIESCMDFLSKYTFSNCSAVPPKHSITDFILDRKQSCSWLVGQKAITITTSGCNQRVSGDGLCEECNRLCKSVDHIVGGSTNDEVAHYMDSGPQNQPHLFRSESDSHANIPVENNSPIGRKRHQSEYQQSTQVNHKPASRAFDDSTLRMNSVSSMSLFRDYYCSCWCQGWAEVLIRSPSGNTSWIQRIQNRLNVPSTSTNTSLADLTVVFTQKEMYRERKPNIDSLRELRKSGNFDMRSYSTPPSVFKRSSSSPEMEKSDNFDSIGDKEQESLNESPENCKRSDFDSPFEETNMSHGDPPSIISFVRSPSSGSMSPAKPSVNKTLERKNSFSKAILKLDLTSTPNSTNSLDSNSQSISPMKPSSPNIACKTPQKASKLDNIPEQGHGGHRERVHTISVMSPASKGSFVRRPQISQRNNATIARSSGLSPAFVFLQYFYNTSLNESDRPVLLPNDDIIQKSFRVLDLILPYETHRIGVVNIADGQAGDPAAILSNQSGSVRYTNFLKGLANLINLANVKDDEMYLGGLATDGSDGQFAYYWEDSLTQVMFHVATLMPNKKGDPQRHAKKAHVGNDYVVIVYNDSCEHFKLNTLKGRGQFTYVCIVITPGDYQTNVVTVQTIPEMADLIGYRYPVMLSDASLSQFVRQLSIQANVSNKTIKSVLMRYFMAQLASIVYRWRIDNPQSPYASNLVERLRKIKQLRQKALNFTNSSDFCSSNSPFKPTHSEFAADNDRHGAYHSFPDDFTNYV
ncbi:hypothetical protein B4U80_07926 [Leptotrombidium deliense]|uniref:Rap-GAP domain-containing protein n=1 Tax=Leptotrombidium deliense TaxID=299467 RepID=A0A443SU28_9ACAR|nr:hypothetical protein B4U80_07926 [Leptotrombidium deliense]